MFKDKMSKYLIGGAMAVVGLVAGIATMAAAQSATTTTTPATNTAVTTQTSQTVDTPEPGDVPDVAGTKTHGHAPLGGDGVVSSINGTTVVIGEESDEGGASYTVDASKATVTLNGVAGSLSDIKIGEKVFVQGAVSGTNVVATSISVGHKGEADKAGDTDGSAAKEAGESTSATDAGE
jgi:hypothetical protein